MVQVKIGQVVDRVKIQGLENESSEWKVFIISAEVETCVWAVAPQQSGAE